MDQQPSHNAVRPVAEATTKIRTTFTLRYRVERLVAAPVAAVWAQLTDARAMPQWNSTVNSIEGDIRQGSKLTLRVPAAPGRTFRVKVVEFVPESRMVWQDGFAPMFRGTRTFTLSTQGQATLFAMEEVFQGLMLPLITSSLPDFGPVFDRYASDLAAVCET